MAEKSNDRILRKPHVQDKVGLSDATIYREEKAGRFPHRLRLGGNSVGWLESEVNEWIRRKAEERV
jgi:prophage regulatory protein